MTRTRSLGGGNPGCTLAVATILFVAVGLTSPLAVLAGDAGETRENIRKLVDQGVAALYIHGNQADKFCAAGNADLIAVLLALCKSKNCAKKYPLGWCIDLTLASKIARFGEYAFKVPIPINQPGVGANAFAHASGIHADGVLKDPGNYELYGFQELGRGEPIKVETGREIITGQYSGISGFSHVMGKLDLSFHNKSRDEANEVLELVRYANVEAQKPLVEDELLFIAKYPRIAKKLLTLTPGEE